MKYLFILGRNLELSKREVLSYFEKEGNLVLNYDLVKNGLLVNLERSFDAKELKFLGGVLSVGEVLASGGKIEESLEKIEIYLGEKNKLNYLVWDFSENYETVQNYLKNRFRSEKLKASEKHLNDSMKMQGGGSESVPSSKLLDEEYFVFGGDVDYFGKIVSHCDYESIEKRDMEKPVRRESLAISPRLAKAMINLAGLKKGDKMLDAFCGIGVFLEEALLQGISVVGVDKDKEAIDGAEKNLEWFGFSKEDYQLNNLDSTEANIPWVSAMVNEPHLGDVLKKIPTKEKAENTLKDFERLIVQVINNVKKKVSGRIVFTSPYIRIGKKRLACNIENICSRTGYNLIEEGIPEFREGQVVGRMIYVLEKN